MSGGKRLHTPQEQLWAKAAQVKKLKKVELPKFPEWNYGPCKHHDTPRADCEYQACGGEPFAHQGVSASYHYVARKSGNSSKVGTGKCQPLSAKILSPTGWKTMGDMRVGSRVLTPSGGESRVVGVYPQGVKPIYKITLTDGSVAHATLDHLWCVDIGNGASRHSTVMSTQRMLEVGLTYSNGHRFALPPVIVDGIDQRLPIDPYVMGALIGDGGTNTVKSYVEEAGLNTTSHFKHIPDLYMRGSYKQRLSLLQGLMDTDGSSSGGSLEFCVASERLAHDIANLVRSLGGYARVVEKPTSWTYGGVKKYNTAWRVGFNCPVNPFRISKKADCWVGCEVQKERRIASIEYSHEEEAQCIQIGDPEHLYVTDDYIPTHNTNSLALTMVMTQHAYRKGKYPDPLRACVVVPTSAVGQWKSELNRWVPGLRVAHVPPKTPLRTRVEMYTKYTLWDVLVIGYHTFTRDVDVLVNVPFTFFISDDVDPIHNVKNKTHKAAVKVAGQCDHVIVANATPLQTHLGNLYGAMVPVGGPSVFGTMSAFERKYVKREPVYIPVGRDAQGKVIEQKTMPVVGYQNMDELARLYSQMHIRYTYEDIADDVRMPEVMSMDVPIEIHPAQRSRYEELQAGIMTLLRDNSQTPQQKMVTSLARFSYGGMILAGLPALKEPDGPHASAKLDWVMKSVTEDFAEEKVVVYMIHKGTVAALQNRLTEAGVGYATIDGSTEDKRAQQQLFWQDPQCRVMILSAAGERSLNLQCANVLIMVDSPYNPARVTQIAGRLRRAGSKHATIRVFKLYALDTQEDRLAKVLAARQIVADAVHMEEDDSNLFVALSPDEVLRLIKP